MNTIFDPLAQCYSSQRFPIYAREGMINCSSPQAAAAGLEALHWGGNAIDAAVAAASALPVVEPSANGIGSDAFALVWSAKDQKLYGLNASGPAPQLATIQRVLEDGKDSLIRLEDAHLRLDCCHCSRRSQGLGGAFPAVRPDAPQRGYGPGHPLRPGGLSLCPQPFPDVEAGL